MNVGSSAVADGHGQLNHNRTDEQERHRANSRGFVDLDATAILPVTISDKPRSSGGRQDGSYHEASPRSNGGRQDGSYHEASPQLLESLQQKQDLRQDGLD